LQYFLFFNSSFEGILWLEKAESTSPSHEIKYLIGFVYVEVVPLCTGLNPREDTGLLFLIHSAKPTSTSSSDSDSLELMWATFFWYRPPLESW
jgi:hypothetical protein